MTALSKHQHTLASDGAELPARTSYAEHEREGVHEQKSRLAKRAKIGKDWDGKAANDNLAWPLATALIREGNTELLKAAMYYRKIHDTAKSEAKLGGSSVRLGDGMALDRQTTIRPDGKIVYRQVKQSTAADADIPARRRFDASALDDSDASEKNWSNIPKPWHGDDPVNNMIDAQAKLASLRSRLGILVEPLERSVVDCETYEEIGYSLGEDHKRLAISSARAVIHLALVSIRDVIGNISRSVLT